MIHGDDIAVAGAGDVDIALIERIFHGFDLEALHSSLQGADGIDLSDNDAGTVGAHGLCATFAHIAITADDDHLASHHHVGGALDAVSQRLAAAVLVVEFGLCHRIVDVDGREKQLTALHHLVQTMHTGGRLFGNALNLLHHVVPMVRILLQHLLQRVENHSLLVGFGFGIENRRIIFGLAAQMDEQGGISAIIHNELRTFAVGERKGVHGAPPVVFEAFTLPGENANAVVSNSGGSVILRGENVAAAPADFRTEVRQRLNQHSGLDGHVQRTHDTHTLQRLAVTIFLTNSQQTRHLLLGDINVLVSPFRQPHVGDFVF